MLLHLQDRQQSAELGIKVDQGEEDSLRSRIAQFSRAVSISQGIRVAAGCALGTTRGIVRTENQDRAIVVSATYEGDPARNFRLIAVCDGVGGLAHGGEAASMAVGSFVSRVVRTTRLNPVDRLKSAAFFANSVVQRELRGEGGCTLAALLLPASGAPAAVTAGDSRVYAFGRSKKIEQLSKDDTLAAYLEGHAVDNPARAHLLQYVGMGENFDPHTIELEISEHNHVILTTDGIHHAPAEVLTNILSHSSSGTEMVEKFLALNYIMGGRDNGTVVVWSSQGSGDTEFHPGITVELTSPFENLEIWIPVSRRDPPLTEALGGATGEAKAASKRRSDLDTTATPAARPEGVRQRPLQNRPKKSSRKPRTRSSGRNDKLPLEPPPKLSIEFPAVDEGTDDE